MRTLLVWTAFFATSVYGHVALKAAVSRTPGSGLRQALDAATTTLGASAFAAWSLSCLFWTLALARHPLHQANSISAARYALVCLAAWAFLQEAPSGRAIAGMALIASGIALVAR